MMSLIKANAKVDEEIKLWLQGANASLNKFGFSATWDSAFTGACKPKGALTHRRIVIAPIAIVQAPHAVVTVAGQAMPAVGQSTMSAAPVAPVVQAGVVVDGEAQPAQAPAVKTVAL